MRGEGWAKCTHTRCRDHHARPTSCVEHQSQANDQRTQCPRPSPTLTAMPARRRHSQPAFCRDDWDVHRERLVSCLRFIVALQSQQPAFQFLERTRGKARLGRMASLAHVAGWLLGSRSSSFFCCWLPLPRRNGHLQLGSLACSCKTENLLSTDDRSGFSSLSGSSRAWGIELKRCAIVLLPGN
jgi:hypothetical protein